MRCAPVYAAFLRCLGGLGGGLGVTPPRRSCALCGGCGGVLGGQSVQDTAAVVGGDGLLHKGLELFLGQRDGVGQQLLNKPHAYLGHAGRAVDEKSVLPVKGDIMSLTNYDYSFVSEQIEFYTVNEDIFDLIKNAIIEQVYAVWDCIDQKWFDDAPMLVKTSVGTLSVNVKSDVYIAIGWNDISLFEKLRWFDETQSQEIVGLNWVENLEWRGYNIVHQICGEQIESILFHPCSKGWGVGIGLKCKSRKCLWIYDAGDVISAKVI